MAQPVTTVLPKVNALQKVTSWLERVLGENGLLLVFAAIIGILGGGGAVAFRELIDVFRHCSLMAGKSVAELRLLPWYALVIPPAAGGLLVGPLIYLFAREAKGHGIPEVMNAVANNGGRIRRRVAIVKIIASAITIGTGGSVGREGPIVQIGAGVGSSIGRSLRFDGNRLIVLLGCGAAAGMAATFNAPIAGVIVAVEIIIGSATINVFSPLVVASVAGTVVTRLVYGDETFISVPHYTLVNPALELPLYVMLGLAAGLAAFLFTGGIVFMEDLWEKLPIPSWLSPMFGGALVGVMALKFPELLGVGYETVFDAVHGQAPALLMAALVVLKILAAGISLGSGGSGGVFAPALFVGACLGGAFGLGVEALFPGQTAHSGAYALVGMGAVLAGATHAPITAIIMLFELSATYTIILPLMLSCIIALVISTRLLPTSIFTTRLLRRGIQLRSSSESEVLRSTLVDKVLHPFPETVLPVTPVSQVVEMALRSSGGHLFVVDQGGKLLGEITLQRIKSIFRESDFDDALMLAVDIMTPLGASVTIDDTLDVAMNHISRIDTEVLPVLDHENRLAGTVSRHDIMIFFEHEVLRSAAASMKFVSEHTREDKGIIELGPGQIIERIQVGDQLAGKNLRELDLRAQWGIHVISIERRLPSGVQRLFPDPQMLFQVGDVLSITGVGEQIAKFKEQFR